MLRRLYDWTLSLASRPAAPYALGAVSFAESSFFPMPPDVMLVPMALARPDRVWFYALIATVTSVLGGLFGYAIGGAALRFGRPVAVQSLRADRGRRGLPGRLRQYGHWVILLKGLTPIPYKLVTITSGFAGYDLFWFVVLSIITRGARFFLLAALLGRYGAAIKGVIDTHFNKVMAGLAVTDRRRLRRLPLSVLMRRWTASSPA